MCEVTPYMVNAATKRGISQFAVVYQLYTTVQRF